MYRKALYRQTGTNPPLATEVSALISSPAKCTLGTMHLEKPQGKHNSRYYRPFLGRKPDSSMEKGCTKSDLCNNETSKSFLIFPIEPFGFGSVS